MKRLLVICPTMNRSKRIEEFLESFQNTRSEGTDLILGCDQNDPEFSDYHKLSNTYDFGIGLFAGENITKIFNEISSNEFYDYYMPTNDDFVFQTSGWDNKLISTIEQNGKGIAYGNDLFQGENCPATSVISSEIIRALGWLQEPSLSHLYGDRVWQTIGNNAKCLYYRPDVIIEHKHFVVKKSDEDNIYQKTNSENSYKKGGDEFARWLMSGAEKDIRKVMAVCQK